MDVLLLLIVIWTENDSIRPEVISGGNGERSSIKTYLSFHLEARAKWEHDNGRILRGLCESVEASARSAHNINSTTCLFDDNSGNFIQALVLEQSD